ncbi:MAG: hypothetical protein Ct9H300mP18_13590 [Candidatus Neomarinimicrobiota bacterium]|nr:MAG: hypothetical protein Ct9H300mP18_13590 [Candidatus Neomarinimicrobiota bacterium]
MSGAIIITTPQDIALADVKKELTCLEKSYSNFRVIENMSSLQLTGKIKGTNQKI